MHSILWASILASALVAVVTTLLVEYLAKPWLEVRKDRILESDRQRRAAIKAIKASSILRFNLREASQRKERNDYIYDWSKQKTAELEKVLMNLYQTADIPLSVRGHWMRALGKVTGVAIGFQDPVQRPTPKEMWDKFDSASNCLDTFAVLLATSRWHPWRRRKLIRKINWLNARYSGPWQRP